MTRLGLAASVIGAVASPALLFHVGMRSGSNTAQPLVMILIGIWVVSPFLILFALNAVAPSKPLHVMMIIVAVMSVVVYLWAAAAPDRPKPAAPFVGLPPLCWILIAIAFFVGRRRVQRSDSR